MGLTRAERKRRFYADLFERTAWTFVQAFLSTWIALGFDLDENVLQSALVAAGLAAAKALTIARAAGNQGTASTLPASLDPATPPGTAPGRAAPLTGSDGRTVLGLIGAVLAVCAAVCLLLDLLKVAEFPLVGTIVVLVVGLVLVGVDRGRTPLA